MACDPTVDDYDFKEDLRRIPSGGCRQRVWYECRYLLRGPASVDNDVDGTVPNREYLWRRVCCERGLFAERLCHWILYRPRNDEEWERLGGSGECLHIERVVSEEEWDDLVVDLLDSCTEEQFHALLRRE